MTKDEQEDFIRHNRNIPLDHLCEKTGLNKKAARKILENLNREMNVPAHKPSAVPAIGDKDKQLTQFFNSHPILGPLVGALNFSVALHVFLAGLFMFLWLAENRVHFMASLFGSFVFTLGGAYFFQIYLATCPTFAPWPGFPWALFRLPPGFGQPRVMNHHGCSDETLDGSPFLIGQ